MFLLEKYKNLCYTLNKGFYLEDSMRKIIKGADAVDVITVKPKVELLVDKIDITIGRVVKTYENPVFPLKVSLTPEDTEQLEDVNPVVVTTYKKKISLENHNGFEVLDPGFEVNTFCGYGAVYMGSAPIGFCGTEDNGYTILVSCCDNIIELGVWEIPENKKLKTELEELKNKFEDYVPLEDFNDYLGTEEPLDTQAKTIVGAINEHEGDLIGLDTDIKENKKGIADLQTADTEIRGLVDTALEESAETKTRLENLTDTVIPLMNKSIEESTNHIFVDNNEQVYLHFMTDFKQHLFQNNTWFLDGEVSYNVPEPKSLYVILDFSKVVPTTDTANPADHVFGVYKNDYSRILAIYCTRGSTDEKIKITMLQGGHTIEAEILPSDNVILESGTGYHKLFVNGELVGYPITQDIKADKIILGNADNTSAFLEDSAISYKAYVMELTEEQEKAFVTEPTDVVEDIVIIDSAGNTKKLLLPTADTSALATKDQLSTGLATKAPVRPMVAIHSGDSIDLLENTDYMSLIPIDNLTITNYSTSRYETTVLFSSGDTATVLTLPENLKWRDNKPTKTNPNKTYQITIRNGLWGWDEF